MEKIIGEALEVYKEIIGKKGIYLHQQIAGKIVYGDEPMIKSIIRNLVDNAVKNTPNGTITITSDCTQEELCEIIIADEGKGMTEEQIVAINGYFQSDNENVTVLNFGIRAQSYKRLCS